MTDEEDPLEVMIAAEKREEEKRDRQLQEDSAFVRAPDDEVPLPFLARCVADEVENAPAELEAELERWRTANSPLTANEWLGMTPAEYALVLESPSGLARLVAGHRAVRDKPKIETPDDVVGLPADDLADVRKKYRRVIRDADVVFVHRGPRRYETIKDRQIRKCRKYLTISELANRLERCNIEPYTKIVWIRRFD